MIKIAISTDKPEIEGQNDFRWDIIYDEYLCGTFKVMVFEDEAGVSALMSPRIFLEKHLLDYGYKTEDFREIGALYVKAQYRHLKLATYLIKEQEAYLAQRGLRAVCCIMNYNIASQKFFTALGYEYIGNFTGVDGDNLVFIAPL